MHTREEKLQAFGRILDVMDEVREKCPWDKKQTNESLRPQTLEEVYELSDAILKGEDRELAKEIGDVLLHIVFYAKIGEEKQQFDIADVINLLCDKLIYRHPHVFSTAEVGNVDDVVSNSGLFGFLNSKYEDYSGTNMAEAAKSVDFGKQKETGLRLMVLKGVRFYSSRPHPKTFFKFL